MKQLQKLLARERLGTRWAKCPISRCRLLEGLGLAVARDQDLPGPPLIIMITIIISITTIILLIIRVILISYYYYY